MSLKNNTLKFLIIVFITVSLFLMIEGLSNIILSVQGAVTDPTAFMAERRHTEYDKDLGWINKPNIFIRDMYGAGKHFRTNAQRFRNDTDFSKQVPAGKVRVIVAGDSFTLGYGVDNESTWLEQMERFNKRLELVNMGQGGYGVDQAFLWYKRDGVRLDHDIVILAFITDDFSRMNNKSFRGYGKPMLQIENDALVVKNQPVPKYQHPSFVIHKVRNVITGLGSFRLLQKIFYHDSHSRGVETYPLIMDKMVDDIQTITKEKHAIPLLVYLPTYFDYTGNSAEPWRRYIADLSKEKKIIFFDLIDEFRKLSPTDVHSLFSHEQIFDYQRSAGHYSEKGNIWIAKRILQRFSTNPEVSSRMKLSAEYQ